MAQRSSKLKRKLEPEPRLCNCKKLRSSLRRRRRFQISPVLFASSSKKKFIVSGENPTVPVVSVDSSCCSYFNAEVSFDSTKKSVECESKGRSNGDVVSVQKDDRVEYQRNRRFEKPADSEVEMSESSCVDSNSGVRKPRSLIVKLRSGKVSKNNVKETETHEGSEACTKSETTCEMQCSGENSKSGITITNTKISSEIAGNDVVSDCCGVPEHFVELGEEMIREKENRSSELEFSQVYGNNHEDVNRIEIYPESSAKQGSNHFVDDSDLVCTEQLSYEDVSEHYSSSQGTTISDLYSEIFPDSELEFSDFFTDSGSQFTDGSVGETPSPTFSLFIQYNDEFSRLTSPASGNTLCLDDDTSPQPQVCFLKYSLEFKIVVSNGNLGIRPDYSSSSCMFSKLSQLDNCNETRMTILKP